MRLLFLATLLLLLHAPRSLAGDLPDWVPVADVERARDLFPKADVVQILNAEEVKIGSGGLRSVRIRSAYHVREGSGGDCDQILFTESSMRKLKKLRGWRRDEGGRVEVFEKPVTTQLYGGELYAEEKESSIRISGVAPGAVVATEIQYEDRSPFFGTTWWKARGGLPVLSAVFELVPPDERHVEAYWFDPASAGLTSAVATPTETGALSWRRDKLDVPGEEEPFAPPDHETSPVLLIRIPTDEESRAISGKEGADTLPDRNWKSVADWADSYFRSALEGKEGLQDVAAQMAGADGEFDSRVRRVADFVRGSVGYVQIYLGDGGLRPHPAVDVYRNRFGDCKDMSHLLIALLALNGIRSYPVLTNVGNSDLIWPEFPMNSFNHCIVAVERPEASGSWVFLDPTAKTVPYGRLASFLEGAPGLVVGAPEDTSLILLPASGPEANLNRMHVEITLEPGLAATARVHDLMVGQLAFSTRERFRALDPAGRKEAVLSWLADRFAAARLVSLDFPDLEPVGDSLTIVYEVRIPEAGRSVGDLVMLQPDFVSGHSTRLFPKKERWREIVISYPYRTETVLELRFPEEWTAKEIPPEAAFENRFGTFSRRYELGAGSATVTRTEQILERRLPAADYPLVQEWDRACYEADRKRLVLQRP